MNRITKVFTVVTLGIGVAGTSCGSSQSDDAASPRGGSTARGGTSGRGGSSGVAGRGGSGVVAGRGGSGTSAEGGMSDDAGSGGTLPGSGGSANRGGSGGKAGTAGKAASGGRAGKAGSTGVGGTVTAGTGGEPDGRHCIAASSVKWAYTPQAGYEHVVGTYATNLAASGIAASDAVLALSLLLPDTGSFTLGTEGDANLATCKHCLQGKIWGLDGADRDFFADAGELAIAASSDTLNGVIHATLTGAQLSEVTIDGDTAETTPVPDGFCIDLADGPIDVEPSSPGTGGEGGAAGASGAGNEGGAAGAAPLPTNCVDVGVGAWSERVGSDETSYFSFLSPNVGSGESDLVGLLEYADDVGTLQLGSGIDATFDSCLHCLLVNIPDGSSGGRNFFAMSGTLDIAPSSQPLAGTMDATFSNVTLVEVDYNFAPLAGGDCLHLASSSISLP